MNHKYYQTDFPEDDADEPNPFESRQFFELCQSYRHSKLPQETTAAFTAMKEFACHAMCRAIVWEGEALKGEIRSVMDSDSIPGWLFNR